MTNLPALGRFRTTSVSFPGAESNVALITNLTGEPVRFTLNEGLDTLVPTATLLILNADISELGETTSGVYSSDVDASIVEEDEARWGTVYSGASVEPNQLVMVTEIVGSFTTSIVNGITTYIAGENSETCTTYWRVVTFTVYEDDKGVPYCDISMESLIATILEKTIKDIIDVQPINEGISFGWTISYNSEGGIVLTPDFHRQQTDFLMFVDQSWFDGKRLDFSANAGIDGYAYAEEDSEVAGPNGIMKFTTADEWLNPFLDVTMGQLTATEDGYLSFSGDISGLIYMPCQRIYRAGEEAWKCVEEMLSFNRIVARFKRDFSLVQWTVDDEGYGDTVDIGDYGVGIKATYTKDNVYNNTTASGFVGAKDDSGLWKPNDKSEVKIKCTSALATNVLNGSNKQLPDVVIPADYLLSDSEQIKNWGEKELYKSFLQARGISVDSDSMPLSLEVGMTISGTSKLFGTVSLLITTFSRTTDAQAKTVNTSIGGRAISISGGIGWT